MNVAFLFKKTPIVFLLLLCFVISFNFAEAERSIRVRKINSHISPRHITLSARSGNGVYARRYAYGRSIPTYSTKGILGKNRRFYSVRSGPEKRRNLSRNYASGYPNWTPNVNASGRKDNPRADNFGPQKQRKGLFPFLKEPPLGFKQKRRARPNRFNSIQKPRPPKTPDEFDDDYFFPEEAQRTETKYEFESRFPRPKKKRRPDPEQNFRKPDFSNIPYYDEKPLPYKTKPREPPFSYSSFVQHPSGYQDDSEDVFEDPEGLYSQTVVKKKKKRVKKPNSRKKNKDQYKPFVFENDQSEESYPPYATQDEYELPAKRYKKRNKPTYDDDNDEDDFVPNVSTAYAKPKPQINTLFNTEPDYRASQNTQKTSQFNPSYSQSWSQANVIETTPRPVQYQTENGFQPQQFIPNQYSYNKDYSNLQTVKTPTNIQQSTYYPHLDNNYKSDIISNKYRTDAFNNNYNYVNTKLTNSQQQPQTPTNYKIYSNNVYSSQSTYSQQVPSGQSTYSQQVPSSQSTYSQQVPSSSSTLTDVTIQKSVPVYDNTETFYNFNNNAYVNSQSSKYYNQQSVSSPNYGTRLSTSYRNKLGDKTDSDNEFIKKHQNLYNNGLSGVPIQGDGYAKESAKKDYDIGYGDFQFDENPTS